MSAEELNVKVGAETEGLQAGMSAAAITTEQNSARMAAAVEKMALESKGAVASMQGAIKTSMSGISETISKATAVFGMMSVALMGGAAFKNIIGETIKWTGESVKLSKSLGITTQEASILNLALGDTYNSMDTMLRASNMITKTLKGNEDAFKALHVETRDGQGNYKNTRDLIEEVNGKLGGMKEGTDRNVAGMTIYGRAWGEIKGLLKLTPEVMEEAKRKAEELHLIVGPEGVKQMKAYKAAMNDVEDVAMSAKIQIGNSVMPAFIAMGAWFNQIGPQALQVFEGALKGVITFVQLLGLGVVTAFELVKSAVKQVIAYTVAAASAIAKVLQGDLKGAADALTQGWTEGGAAGEQAFNNIGKAVEATNDSLAKMWGLKKQALGKGKAEAPEGETFDATKAAKEAKSQMPEFKAELDNKKLAEDAFLASSLKDDLAFWEQKKKNGHLNAEDQKAVNHEILVLKKEIQKEELGNDLEAIKLRMEREKAGSQARSDIWEEGLKRIAAAYGLDSKEYKAALLEKEKLAREHTALLVHLADSITEKNREISKIDLDIEAGKVSMLRQIGAMSAEEEITATRNLENRKAAIEEAAIREKLAREQVGTLEHRKLLNQLETAEAQHTRKMSEIDNKAAVEQTKTFQTVFDTVQRSFSSAIQGMISGTMGLAQAMRQIAGAILNTFIDLGVKMVFDWIRKQIMLTTVTSAQEATRTGIAETAQATTLASAIATNVATAASYAAVGAAAAMASVAAIPIVGWAMAPGVGAAAYGEGMGFAALASASGGWDQIPEDQVAQVHKNEMILPAELAEGVRSNLAGGAKDNNQSGGGHIYISAVDAKGVKRLLSDNGGALATVLKNKARNFAPLKRG
jgi:hypothetical protein